MVQQNLIKRIGRIISASFNSTIEAIENTTPETAMAEAAKKIDAAIDDVRVELGRVMARKHMAGNRLKTEKNRLDALAQQIEAALQKGQEDVAEGAIAQQLDIEAQLPILEKTVAEGSDQQQELEGYIKALLAKKRQMQAELNQTHRGEMDIEEYTRSTEEVRVRNALDIEYQVARAETDFNLASDAGSGSTGTRPVGDRRTSARLAEIDEIDRQARIKERLSVMKGARNKK